MSRPMTRALVSKLQQDIAREIEEVLDATEPNTHRCGQCYGPYGRSALPCPNNPHNIERKTA